MLQNYIANLQFDHNTKELTKISTGEVVQANADVEDFDAHVTGILKKTHPEMFVPIYDARGHKIN